MSNGRPAAASSSSRIGTPVLAAWMPIVLVSSSVSSTSAGVAPSASARRTSSAAPGPCRCEAALSTASRTSALTFGSSGPRRQAWAVKSSTRAK